MGEQTEGRVVVTACQTQNVYSRTYHIAEASSRKGYRNFWDVNGAANSSNAEIY